MSEKGKLYIPDGSNPKAYIEELVKYFDSIYTAINTNVKKVNSNIDLIKQNSKEVLTLKEVADYTGLSRSYLYKLTMRQEIPHYKPNGKQIYFNRLEVEKWLQSNRVATQEELAQQAQTYCMKGGRK